MINPTDFQEGEFDAAFTKLQNFANNEVELNQEVMKYFAEYDDDNNAFLDRRELR